MPNQMLSNILLLEENIGDALSSVEHLRNYVFAAKIQFYGHFYDAVRERLETT